MQLLHRDRDVLGVIAEGSEAAFMTLVDRHQAAMLRLAEYWLEDEVTAEIVVEQTWLAVLGQLQRVLTQVASGVSVDARACAPMKVWLFAMLLRHLRSRAFAVEPPANADEKLAPDAERFSPPGDRWEGHWRRPPVAWPGRGRPEPSVAERGVIEKTIRGLPRMERAVLVLRDMEGLSIDHVSRVVDMGDAEHTALLHAARSQLRAALDHYYERRSGVR